jgi:uncharacterized membrane protein YeaQ/YmgE (transglycosylase-associated protein family)
MIEEATIDVPAFPGRLYSIAQITVATFVGSPIAGCLLLAHNFRELGVAKAAWHSLIWGVVSTIILLVVASWLPEKFPNAALPVGYCFAMRQVSTHFQGSSISKHLSAGGKKGSWAATVGIGVACLVLLFAVFFGSLLAWYSVVAA